MRLMYADQNPLLHPWHLRNTVVRHHQWFDNLTELHRITLSWPETTPESLQKLSPPEDIAPFMGYLPILAESEPKLESILRERWPDPLLSQLEKLVHWVQDERLGELIKKKPDWKAINEAADRLGHQSAVKRWPKFVETQPDLRQILLMLEETPFSGYPHSQGILVKRALTNEACIDLLACPGANQPELCAIYQRWIHGFISAFDARIQIDAKINSPGQGCTQTWQRDHR